MQWSPRPAQTAVLAGTGLALAVVVLVLDAPGRLLVGMAALALLAAAIRDVVARPRLSADVGGVVVRSWGSRRHLPWSLLRIRVRTTRRLGLTGRALELDTAMGADDPGVLVLLGRRELGADPDEVARALRALDPTGRQLY